MCQECASGNVREEQGDASTLLDAYTPREIAHRMETLGVTKVSSDTLSLLVLAVLAGAFIALGALFFTVVVARSAQGCGVSRLVGGVAFSLGLILVSISGAELFTGNNLAAMAWASGRITSSGLLQKMVRAHTRHPPSHDWCRRGERHTRAPLRCGHVGEYISTRLKVF
jgi:hypothetical protein